MIPKSSIILKKKDSLFLLEIEFIFSGSQVSNELFKCAPRKYVQKQGAQVLLRERSSANTGQSRSLLMTSLKHEQLWLSELIKCGIF